jgi:Rrf2 family transcriptional regulator, nitric oxide-sensitive transcriptional repressor
VGIGIDVYLESGACLIAPACVLQTALKEAMAVFLAVLDRYMIADLAVSPSLIRLLEAA